MVEFALVGGILVVLGLGIADFGRVLGTNAQVVNAAREAARQVTAYEQVNKSEPGSLDNFVRTAAENEMGCDPTKHCLTPQGCPFSSSDPDKPPANPDTPLDVSMYPTGTDQGNLYVCSWNSSGDSKRHVEVVIAWRASLLTPLIQSLTGQPRLHGIADGTEP